MIRCIMLLNNTSLKPGAPNVSCCRPSPGCLEAKAEVKQASSSFLINAHNRAPHLHQNYPNRSATYWLPARCQLHESHKLARLSAEWFCQHYLGGQPAVNSASRVCRFFGCIEKVKCISSVDHPLRQPKCHLEYLERFADPYPCKQCQTCRQEENFRQETLLYERPEAQCVGCNTRAFNHQITCLLLSAYMAGRNRLWSPVQAVYST
jgi:hypothetical protein